MTETTRKIMTDTEEENFYSSLSELNYFTERYDLEYNIIDNEHNNYSIKYTIKSQVTLQIKTLISNQIRIIESYLQTGKAVLSINKYGRQIVRPASYTIRYDYPISYFTSEEETYFNQCIDTINKVARNDQCKFKPFLDLNSRTVFKYSINDDYGNLESRLELQKKIQFVIQSVNNGKAICVELPNKHTMIMPRFKIHG